MKKSSKKSKQLDDIFKRVQDSLADEDESPDDEFEPGQPPVPVTGVN